MNVENFKYKRHVGADQNVTLNMSKAITRLIKGWKIGQHLPEDIFECQTDDKPIPEPMMTTFTEAHAC